MFFDKDNRQPLLIIIVKNRKNQCKNKAETTGVLVIFIIFKLLNNKYFSMHFRNP